MGVQIVTFEVTEWRFDHILSGWVVFEVAQTR
jgi:hypothetical protein